VRIVAYASVNDIGRVISPTIARGQVEGGAVQGIGQALCEQVVYDAGSSQLVTGSLMTTQCRGPTSASTSAPSSTPRSRAPSTRSGSRAWASWARSGPRRRS
jgi:xanthine dehydrogenase molybdopterin-binding subunit B